MSKEILVLLTRKNLMKSINQYTAEVAKTKY